MSKASILVLYAEKSISLIQIQMKSKNSLQQDNRFKKILITCEDEIRDL